MVNDVSYYFALAIRINKIYECADKNQEKSEHCAYNINHLADKLMSEIYEHLFEIPPLQHEQSSAGYRSLR